MKTLLSIILVMLMVLSDYSLVRAATEKNITVNQVVRAVFEDRKAAIIESVNKRLQNKDFYRGAFFKGEIPEVKKIADKLLKTNPRVTGSPKGFIIIAGKGESRVKVEMEFVDILTGKIRIAGENVQLRKNMSYLEVSRAIGKPVLEPLLEKLKKQSLQKTKKTSLLDPFDLLIPPAKAKSIHGITAFEAAVGLLAGLGTTTLLMSGLKLLLGLFLTGTPLGWGILAGGAIIAIAGVVVADSTTLQLTRWFSKDDEMDIAKSEDRFNKMLLACREDKENYFGKSSSVSKLRIAQLEKDNPQKFKNFQQLQLLSRRVRGLEGHLKSNSEGEQDEIGCHQLSNDLKLLDQYFLTHKSSVSSAILPYTPSELIFFRKLRSLCKIYSQIINCFANAPRPFGEGGGKEEIAIIESSRSFEDSEYDAFYGSLQGVLDAQ